MKVTAVKDELVENNKKINWVPKSIGEGRFGDWLENIQDWGISRTRYWGTPLNIWECQGCGHQLSVGSRKELAELSGDQTALTVELHRPYIDRFVIRCPECGKEMRRVPEVIHCWLRYSIIRLKIRSSSIKSFRPALFPKRSIKRGGGSTPFMRRQPFFSILPLLKMSL